MDKYTTSTQNWLDQRFKVTDDDGIFFAHQPIYGFRKGHCEPSIIVRYIITYQIMNTLSRLQFDSLLDVGGAEGYKAALVRSLFNVSRVKSVDLSQEACNRAKEIFNVDGEVIDIHQLPYEDNEFDVVLCSETLEHVTDIEKATKELIRVCRKAVVITVPHEPEEFVANNIRNKVAHAHIHSLNLNSFDFTLASVTGIVSRRLLTPVLKNIAVIADATSREKVRDYPAFVVKMYNRSVSLFRFAFGKRATGVLMKLDDCISNAVPSYSGMVFILLKDPDCYSQNLKKGISKRKILDFEVPFHYMR